MRILAFSDYRPQADRLAARLNLPLAEVDVQRFPDGESLVVLPPDLPDHLLFCRSLNLPNDKLIELMLAANTARENGATRLTLIAPYLCYMRQNFTGRPGEAASQRHIGRLLAELFDDVITVDPALRRNSNLQQAVPITHALSLSATKPIAEFLKSKLDRALLLGPDNESRQETSRLASLTGFDFRIAEKVGPGDSRVTLKLPDADYAAQPVVVVDDMALTGRTIAGAAAQIKARGGREIYAVVTHPLFCGNAERAMREAGVRAVWSTDSIPHPSSCIRLDGLLAGGVKAILGND